MKKTTAQMKSVKGHKPDEKSRRRPLFGYEDFYEINSEGDVFSKRSNRFIRHQQAGPKKNSKPVIEISINGVKRQITIGQAIADSFLSNKDKANIIHELPEGISSLDDLVKVKPTLADALGKYYRISPRAILSVMRGEFDRRNGVEKAGAELILVDGAGKYMRGTPSLQMPVKIRQDSPSQPKSHKLVSVPLITVPETIIAQLTILQSEIAALSAAQPDEIKATMKGWANQLNDITETKYASAQVSEIVDIAKLKK